MLLLLIAILLGIWLAKKLNQKTTNNGVFSTISSYVVMILFILMFMANVNTTMAAELDLMDVEFITLKSYPIQKYQTGITQNNKGTMRVYYFEYKANDTWKRLAVNADKIKVIEKETTKEEYSKGITMLVLKKNAPTWVHWVFFDTPILGHTHQLILSRNRE